MDGFIKLHRKIMEWEWYSDINVTRVFIHCLLRANHADKKWQGILIKKGSFVTSLENLAFETTLTKRQVRTALDKLKMTHELTHQPTHQYSMITINNWDKFQLNDTQVDTQMTHERHTNDTRATLNKNDKNDKNIIHIVDTKKVFKKPTLEEIKSYCLERNNNVSANQFYDYYESNGWKVGKNSMKDWKATIRTWERNEFGNKKKEEPFDYANTPWNPYR